KLTGITNESATSDITLTYTNINGNTKDGLHNTNTGDFTFVADHSTISNNGLSGITSESATADISLTYVSITGNTGSGVDSTTTGGETNFYAFNTTIANNKVDGIQLDSDTSINALILDSSLINNTAKGINVTSPDTTVSLYNNLLFRNGTDIHYGTAGTLQGAYNIYKTTSQDFTDESRYNTIADETHGQMLETGNVNNDGTITIGTTGQAAYRGSLLAKVNDDIYFINRFSGHWESITSDTKVKYDTTNADGKYGLTALDPNAVLYLDAQNLDENNDHVQRNETILAFNVGAYALKLETEAPSTIVTTDQDILNPWDNNISLREAVYYTTIAGQDHTVTFDNDLFQNGEAEITLDSFYGEIKITTNDLQIDGGADRNVIIDAAVPEDTNYRILSANDENETWDITLNNLTLTGGNVGEFDQDYS
ncbi:MAG TPA: right-handed parallel beta-helix repeat-containing protein, partial [Planctomycetota bacterium]|nr:right-handed parallel beta-helix repeat-containing protein [Planctomycetota bacterium]